MKNDVTFASLSPDAMQMSAQAILAAADIVIVLWPDGEIIEVAFGPSVRLDADAAALCGTNITEIAIPDDRPLLSEVIVSAREGHRGVPARIRHSAVLGARTSASYSPLLAGGGEKIVLVGTLSRGGAQLAEKLVDAEIARSRTQFGSGAETRYQTLFESSPDGVMMVDAGSGRIDEANRKAAEILGCAVSALVGSELASHFISEDAVHGLNHAAEKAEAEFDLTTVDGKDCHIESRIVRTLDRTVQLVRLSVTMNVPRESEDDPSREALSLVRRTEVPIIVTDRSGVAVWANGAFTARVPGEPVAGRPVSDLLGLTPHAVEIALVETDRNGRLLTSLGALESQQDGLSDAQIAIVSIPASDPTGYGFVIHTDRVDHELGPRAGAVDSGNEPSDLAHYVGQVPMKDLVRRSTLELERYCIEAALKLTGGNRTEAASVLGLSRQSFYLKLRQHELL